MKILAIILALCASVQAAIITLPPGSLDNYSRTVNVPAGNVTSDASVHWRFHGTLSGEGLTSSDAVNGRVNFAGREQAFSFSGTGTAEGSGSFDFDQSSNFHFDIGSWPGGNITASADTDSAILTVQGLGGGSFVVACEATIASWSITTGGTLAPVPEPAAMWIMLGVGTVIFVALSRRKA